MADMDELIFVLKEAQENMYEAIQSLRWVADETNDGHARAYLIEQLETLVGDGHGYLCGDYNIDKWISDIKEREEQEE